MRTIKSVAMVVMLVVVGFVPTRASFINGGFETGDLTGWTVFTTANGSVGAGLPDVVPFNVTPGPGSARRPTSTWAR